MKTKYVPALLALLFSLCAGAQTPDWSRSVAPIIYNKCASCHRSGGVGPFNLMSISDAVLRAGAIKSAVASDRMPPWPPDSRYNQYAHERTLTAAEKQTVLDWIDGGLQPGDLSLAPPAPVFGNGGELPGTPSLQVRIPVYTSGAAGADIYRSFVIPSGLTADRFITAFEAVPGNRSIVHHVLVYADTTGTCASLDAADPGPGYTTFGGVGTNKAILLGGWVPGTAPMKYPDGFGVRIPAGASIVVQIHYPAGTAGMKDSTAINFFFSGTGATVRDVIIAPALSHSSNIDRPLHIPANTRQRFVEELNVPFNASLLGIAPHMHLIGRDIASFGVRSAGDTQRYIRIPNWDFHWQGFYMFRKIMKIESGTTVYAVANYDNTAANPFNPSNPPKDVHAGEATTDEMMLVYFIFSGYRPGDEDIVIADDPGTASVPEFSAYGSGALLETSPNPANNLLQVKSYSTKGAQLILMDATGRVLRRLVTAPGYDVSRMSTESLPAGTYFLQFQNGEVSAMRSVQLIH